MPQIILPLIPHGATALGDILSVNREGERWTYFVGGLAIFSHPADDLRSFRMITAQLVCEGRCTQPAITRVFGVPKRSVLRAMKRHRQQGPAGFFQPRHGRRGGTVLTGEVLARAQELLNDGLRRGEVAAELGVKSDTLRKAINGGRLRERAQPVATDKSSRSVVDAAAAEGMGTACTRTTERVLAAFGMLDGAPVRFEPCVDVSFGGVLCALPALVANGLLSHCEECLGKVKGYYSRAQVLLLLSFMALCRIKTVERVRGKPPGELGKPLGLDRAPEVRCLRRKIGEMSADGAAETWAGHLSRQWMETEPAAVGRLYVDGHVRVYHGHQTELPRKYVARERLCLRGVTDYWVNDALGRPFFVVEQPVDPGLLQVLRTEIVPRLLKEIPGQPSAAELAADLCLCRFVLVFDREGYSPGFAREMWRMYRIACLTYHKYPGEAWPEAWFTEQTVRLANGESVTMKLAEMGSLIGSDDEQVWVREVRKLTDSGHQTSMIATDYRPDIATLAAAMFARWCQENFFRYMMEHYGLDLLAEYETVDFPDTQRVVNPRWRELDRRRQSVGNKLIHRQARFAAMDLHPQPEKDTHAVEKWAQKKALLLEEIEPLEREMAELKTALAATAKHLQWNELPEKDKFQRLAPGRKRLLDTVHLIAYRAETALGVLIATLAGGLSAARVFLRDLFATEADILPEPSTGRLRVRIHRRATPAFDRVAAALLQHLNDAEFTYPGTELRMQFELTADPLDPG